MSKFFLRIMLCMLIISTRPQTSEGEYEQWCIADEQTPDDKLQVALNWACGQGGADCTKIQAGQPCFFPNTMRDHASYAFNSYFQKYKRQGGTCFFKGAAIITEANPSQGSCQFEYIP